MVWAFLVYPFLSLYFFSSISSSISLPGLNPWGVFPLSFYFRSAFFDAFWIWWSALRVSLFFFVGFAVWLPPIKYIFNFSLHTLVFWMFFSDVFFDIIFDVFSYVFLGIYEGSKKRILFARDFWCKYESVVYIYMWMSKILTILRPWIYRKEFNSMNRQHPCLSK